MSRLVRPLVIVTLVVLAGTVFAEPRDAAKVHFDAGFAAKKANDLDKAVAELRQAVELDKDYLEAHWVLAWVHTARDEKVLAAVQYREVIRLAPDTDKAREAKAALERMGAPLAPAGPVLVSPSASLFDKEKTALRLFGEPTHVWVTLEGTDMFSNEDQLRYVAMNRAAGEDMLGNNLDLTDGLPAAARHVEGLRMLHYGRACILATCRNRVALEQIRPLLGPEDAKEAGECYPLPSDKGVPVIWYEYGWLHFGVVDGTVFVVRVDCTKFAGISTVVEPWKRILMEGRVFTSKDLSHLVRLLDAAVMLNVITRPAPTESLSVGSAEGGSHISYADLVALYGPPDSRDGTIEKDAVVYSYGGLTLYASTDGQRVCSDHLALPAQEWAVLYFYDHQAWPQWLRLGTIPPALALPRSPFGPAAGAGEGR